VDFLSVGGIILAFASVLLCMVIDGGSLMSLVQESAALIVFGGTAGAVLLQTPFSTFMRSVKMTLWVFMPPKDDREEQMKQITEWLRVARHQFVLALDPIADQQSDPFIKQGLRMIVDGIEAPQIRTMMEAIISTRAHEEMQGAEVFEAAGGYAPTVGILGAVMGLITVMSHLDDPSKLGSGIATAFVATVYGVAAANLVCLPIASKLKAVVRRRVRRLELIAEGMVGIAILESPLQLEMKLRGFLEADEMDKAATAPRGAAEGGEAAPAQAA